ncbi:MAG: threonine dehydratase, partial [Candidatus Dormibacteraceae bacterium]
AEILDAMRILFSVAGLAVEPAGAAGLAGIVKRSRDWAGKRVATPLCGSNLTAEQVRAWLQPYSRSRSAR